MRAQRVLSLLLFTAAGLCGVPLCAQSQPGIQPGRVHVQDGGTREKLVSIYVPAMPEAPFSLELDTEWTRAFGSGGGTYTLANHRRIARDSKGRIYQERWALVPKGGKVESRLSSMEISDPAQGVLYNCLVWEKACYIESYTALPASAYAPGGGTSGPLPNGDGFRTHEELGVNTIEGVDTVGYRDTTTINPGVYGNDQPMVTTRESWYAPKMGLNLVSKLESPQSGRQTFTVRELSLSEPEPGLFATPEGYALVDERSPAPAAGVAH